MAIASAIHGQEIINETFEASLNAAPTTLVDSTISWTSRFHRQALSVEMDPQGLNHGKAMRITNGMAYVNFSDVALDVGDSLQLTFQMRYKDASQVGGASPFRVGLYEVTSGNLDDSNCPGYWYMSHPCSPAGKAGFVFEEGTDDSLGGGNDFKPLGPVVVAENIETKPSSFSMTISRTKTGIKLEGKVGDANPVIQEDPEAKLTTFNALAISIVGPGDFLMDDVVLAQKKAGK